MDSVLTSAPGEHRLPAARFKMNHAFAVSVALHLLGAALAVSLLSNSREARVHSAPTLEVSLTAPRVANVRQPLPVVPGGASSKPLQPTAGGEVHRDNETVSAEKPGTEPVDLGKPESRVPQPDPSPPVRAQLPPPRSLGRMLGEVIAETPVAPLEMPTKPTRGTVFDPRLRDKLASQADKAARVQQGPQSFRKNTGGLHVELGDGKCFEVRSNVALEGREVWWHARCPGSSDGSGELSYP